MTLDDKLNAIRDVIQYDVGQRGLRADPIDNLISATHADFSAACNSFSNTRQPSIGIVTGFLIPTADPPRAETDGPLGALFLARALTGLGIRVVLATEDFAITALHEGLKACALTDSVALIELPREEAPNYVEQFQEKVGPLTHLIAFERVGPSHTPESITGQLEGTAGMVERFRDAVSPADHDRCHTMRGFDITAQMSPAHRLFEKHSTQVAEVTIGVGDGGNEIGMGKIAWHTIERNIANGGTIACRVPTDHLIVAGISNWGAYALAAGIALVRGQALDPTLFDVERERELLQLMVECGPLVDGRTSQSTVTVDGVEFEEYIQPLLQIRQIVFNS